MSLWRQIKKRFQKNTKSTGNSVASNVPLDISEPYNLQTNFHVQYSKETGLTGLPKEWLFVNTVNVTYEPDYKENDIEQILEIMKFNEPEPIAGAGQKVK
mmetsp:Transcript_17863/g.19894  ORF Transcript_17863/g.19894 Transcript_17863/m.19894 type:complete len:100 (+) Transcript_17863:179-478(+)